ncbi:bifunctional riboflavin kinase/FMN adenylyltransferase [Marinicauda salina]|uniref:Riboflavin biosynthesis protein n=1 Tax=Marinicauda salina TaxID=2135793 RepID=A0A2U2BSG0_9PROT|nr:bifunctional riboflavin kinase/FAD synthetase [Marinicauda salina]PWE16937.1 bifunctional riboflavin kinase/FMN adenylyltransferase [Marinicauda salina]
MSEIIEGYADLPAAARGGVAALGNFDGVHRGHRAVLDAAAALAAERGTVAVAAVFKPHPRRYFRPDIAPFRLMSDAQRARALAAAGAARIHVIPFGPELAAMSPEAFARDVLAGGLGLDGVVTGGDFRFGKDRAGDAAMLATLGERHGFTARAAPEVDDADGTKISSTAIREALGRGEPETAARLLGGAWRIEGVVARGDERGRTLGFPTANIGLGDYVRPRFGVYAVRATVPGRDAPVPGVANIGRRPTVDGEDERLEVHLFDFEGDLYGSTLEVAIEHFIRPETKFDGLDALKRQIAADSEQARARLGR